MCSLLRWYLKVVWVTKRGYIYYEQIKALFGTVPSWAFSFLTRWKDKCFLRNIPSCNGKFEMITNNFFVKKQRLCSFIGSTPHHHPHSLRASSWWPFLLIRYLSRKMIHENISHGTLPNRLFLNLFSELITLGTSHYQNWNVLREKWYQTAPKVEQRKYGRTIQQTCSGLQIWQCLITANIRLFLISKAKLITSIVCKSVKGKKITNTPRLLEGTLSARSSLHKTYDGYSICCNLIDQEAMKFSSPSSVGLQVLVP